MIVRLWKGRVPAARAEEYRKYQEEVGPPNYVKTPGNLGAYMLGRAVGDEYEIAMLTFWESLDSIRAFAGDDVEKAKYYERDADFLVELAEKVDHYEVLAEAKPRRGAEE